MKVDLRCCILLAAAVCAAAVPSPSTGQNRIITADSTASLELPRSFQPLALNPNAELQFGDSATDSYVMLLLESKADLVGWNLTRHSMITVAQILTNLDMPEVGGPDSLKIGGHPAVQYTLQGATQGMRIAYLHTTIEAPGSFTQIVAWTPNSRWKANEAMMRTIAGSATVSGTSVNVSTDVHEIVQGTWAWESSDQPCSGLTQRFVVADDRKSMKIHHSEPIEDADGKKSSVTDYVIEGSEPGVLHTYIPGETRMTDEGDPAKWDLVVVGRNRITWHRADWPAGAYTGMLRRCGAR